MYKVIFDTNILYVNSLTEFFGNRSELESFIKDAEIIIPDLVIEEIKEQKRNLFLKQKADLEKNEIYQKFIKKSEIERLNFEDFLSSTEADEKINYKTIKLEGDVRAINKIREMSLKKIPPFKKDKDEGFKDAYIHCTILDFIEKHPNEIFYFYTKDKVLADSFSDNQQIKIIESYEEFINANPKYSDEYFLRKLREHLLEESIVKESILKIWKNIEGNDVLSLSIGVDSYVVEISDREIIGSENVKSYQEGISNFINSANFRSTHEAIIGLIPYLNFLTDNEIRSLLEASYCNNQIKWIAGDDDVKEFILNLYEKKKDVLTDKEQKDFFKQLMNNQAE